MKTIMVPALLLGLSASLASIGCGQRSAEGAKPMPIVDVEVAQVQQKDIPIYGEWIGTLDGLVNAEVRAQVTGYLLKQTYVEGSYVRKGQLLFQIDPRPFQAALDQAKAQLGAAQAQLASAEANQRQAQLNEDKYAPLAKDRAASQSGLDGWPNRGNSRHGPTGERDERAERDPGRGGSRWGRGGKRSLLFATRESSSSEVEAVTIT